jgi:hypothetical protein
MRVVIRPLEGEDRDKWGMAEPSVLGKDYWSLTLNSNKLAGADVSDSFKATIGHELFHVMQDLYDPRSAYRVAKFPSSWLWYWEAASTWFESVMLGDDSYIPGTVTDDNYTFATRHGLEYEPGDQESVQGHGYGASMFLQHLTKAYPRTTVGETVKRAADRAPGLLAASLYSPVEAMNSASLYFPVGAKWVEFIEKYAEGKIYAREFPPMPLIIAQKAGSYTFKQDSDTGTTFRWDSPNLSARVFQVLFSQAWPDNTKLTLSLEAAGDSVKAFLYKVTSKGWSKAGSFSNSITLDNAEQFQKDNAQLIIVVADGSGSGKFKSQVPTSLRVQKGGPARPFSDSWTTNFYNDRWRANLALVITAADQGQSLSVVTDRRVGSLRQLVFDSPTGGEFKAVLSVSGVGPVGGGVAPSALKVVGRWTPGGTLAEGTEFQTVFSLAPGTSSVKRDFELVVYDRESDRWLAGDVLISVTIRRP